MSMLVLANKPNEATHEHALIIKHDTVAFHDYSFVNVSETQNETILGFAPVHNDNSYYIALLLQRSLIGNVRHENVSVSWSHRRNENSVSAYMRSRFKLNRASGGVLMHI